MSFPLVGNIAVKRSVESFISSNRIPHAILIEGDEGTGRHTLAEYISRAAVCEGNTPPCGDCRACKMTEHPDIAVLNPEEGKKSFSVSQIRELRAEAFVKPHMAKKRVFIIDGAERMNDQSQNALLKVLEEPPQSVMFILICISRTSLLETIVSRCAPISLAVPEYAEAMEYLRGVSDAGDEALADALNDSSCNIKKALDLLSGAKKSAVLEAAERFIELMFSGSELEMLVLLQSYEKDRIKADEFFDKLKVCTAKTLRKIYRQKSRASALTGLYKNIDRYKELLKTNINLSLLFSAVVCETKQLKK